MSSLRQGLLVLLRKPVIQRGVRGQFLTTGPELREVVEPAVRVRPKASNASFRPRPLRRIPVVDHAHMKKLYRPTRPVFKEPILPRHRCLPEVSDRQTDTVHYKQPERVVLPTSACIQLRNVPPLATLDDICSSISMVLEIERKIGIRDLDSENGELLTPSTPWVKSAKTILSTHGRPTHWKIEFENRSIVHAFLEHSKQAKFICVWKEVNVTECPKSEEVAQVEVNDSMIRVENCPSCLTVDVLRHVFRRYDFAKSGASIFRWESPNTSSTHNMFVIRFADPSYARAAIREMQGLKIKEKELIMAQYPKQLI